MSFIETLIIDVGASIAKSLIKLWIKDSPIAIDASSSLVDVLRSWTTDRISQQKAQRQLEAIGERVAENLLPLFESDGSDLDENSHSAVAKSVAETLGKITSRVIIQNNLEPSRLANYLLNENPPSKYFFTEGEAILYQRIISESCEYIIRIASQLPSFTESVFAEVLKKEGQLLSLVEQIMIEVLRIREQLNPKTEAARFELDYRRAVEFKLNEVQLFGIDLPIAKTPYRLSVAYITLSVEQKNSNSQKWHGNKPYKFVKGPGFPKHQIDLAKDVVPVDKALAGAQYVLIRGAAGSGKTTLLQWIAVNAASQTFKEPLASWNGRLPFYISLRKYVQSDFPPPEAFVRSLTPSIADKMPKGWVHDKLESGRAIILVDGLDEISVAQRDKIREWLKELKKNYPKIILIVTSRPHAIKDGWLDPEGFKDTELQPMELSDIFTFIDYWHNAIGEVLSDKEEKAELPSFASHLKHELEEDRSKLILATSPLLCAMLCALNKERRRQLPTDRIELYEACSQMLVERRDKDRNIALTDYPASVLTYSQKCVLLEDLAYWLIRNGWSEVSREAIDERFRHKLVNIQNISKTISGSDVRQFLLERTGIIRETTVNQIEFAHRTFQEYYAAQAAIDEGDSGVLVDHAHNDQWHEVIILASGLATKRVRETLILKLLTRANSDQDHYYQISLLAVACLETGVEHLGQHVRMEVQSRLRSLVPPRNKSAARALAAAGDLAVPYLTKQYNHVDSNSEIGIVCIYTLILIGSEQALTTLKDYAETANIPAINELLRGMDIFDKEIYTLSILLPTLRKMSSNLLKRFSEAGGFKYLESLEALDLSECPIAIEIINLLEINKLSQLNLLGCNEINNLDFLTKVSNLIDLNLSECNCLNNIDSIKYLSLLKRLNMHNCNRVQDLSSLTVLKQLNDLNLAGCNLIRDLNPLVNLRQLTNLNLRDYGQIHIYERITKQELDAQQKFDLKPLKTLTKLSRLNISNYRRIHFHISKDSLDFLMLNSLKKPDLSSIEKLTQLKELDLSGCDRIEDLNILVGLTSLTKLNVSTCVSIKNFGSIKNLTQLKELDLSGCDRIEDLSVLVGLTKLTKLSLAGCINIKSLTNISGLTQLTKLNLTGCKDLIDISPLEKLTQLNELTLAGCNKIIDLSNLVKLKQLSIIDLSYCENIRDLGVLYKLNSLQKVYLRGIPINRIPTDLMKRLEVIW